MKLILVLLALFVGATLGSIELHDGIADKATSSAYMKRVLDQKPGVDDVALATTSKAASVLNMLPFLGLTAAKKIATRVKLADIINKNNPQYVTMFAPSNAAIKKWKAKLRPEIADDIEVLTTLAKSWIVPNMAVKSKSFWNNLKVPTLVPNVDMRINVYESELKKVTTVNGAKLIVDDYTIGSNVVHVLNNTAFPLPDGPVFDILAKVDKFSILVDLIKTAGIQDALNQAEHLTVLAPTNKAFDKLPANFKDELKADATKLMNVLRYHVVPTTMYTAGILDKQVANSLGSIISVDFEEDGKIILNKRVAQATPAEIIYPDIPAENGAIQVIDGLLLLEDIE